MLKGMMVFARRLAMRRIYLFIPAYLEGGERREIHRGGGDRGDASGAIHSFYTGRCCHRGQRSSTCPCSDAASPWWSSTSYQSGKEE